MKTKILGLMALLSCALASGADLPTVAVVDFTASRPTPVQAQLADLIAEELVNSGRFDVMERDKLQSVLREQSFQASGAADPETAVAFGKLVGVHYLVSGNIQDFGTETHDFAGYGVKTRTTVFRLAASLKVIEVKTGRVLFSKTEEAEDTNYESRGSRVQDDTLGNKLAAAVADKLSKALLAAKAFAPKKTEEAVYCAVRVDSTPANADVEVDGVFVGNAGGSLQFPAGLHSVVISVPGYEKWSKKVQVREGLTISAKLERKADVRIEIEKTEKSGGD